ncbi:MAG: hypothetical protein ACOVQL_07645 [Limnohabitans sp.]
MYFSFMNRPVRQLALANLCLWAALMAQAQVVVRPELVKPLQALQEALSAQKHQDVLDQLRPLLQTAGLTPAELGVMRRMQAVAALGAKNWDLAIGSLQEMLLAPDLPASDRRALQESLMNAAQQKQDHVLLVRTARQYLQEGGTNPSIRPALIQALALSQQHAEVIRELQEKMRLDAASGQKTPENQLRLLALSYRQLKDDAGYHATVKQLLASYPSRDYWAEVAGRMITLPGFNNRFELDVFRLLEQSGNLQEPVDFTEMAGLAMQAGLPAEALRVLNLGYDKGILGQGAQAAAHSKLRTEAQTKVREDDRSFAQLEKSARDGNTLASVAAVYGSRQDWTQAQAVYARALAAGGLRREQEVRLHYAISLFKTGQKEPALAQLKTIQGDATAVELASLWALMMR